MSLLEIKNYLMRVRIASLASLCAYFNCESEVLRGMLGHWIRKGCIRQGLKTAACGTKCGQCSVPVTEIYEWVS
jgi:putative ferrous iron transport protein C